MLIFYMNIRNKMFGLFNILFGKFCWKFIILENSYDIYNNIIKNCTNMNIIRFKKNNDAIAVQKETLKLLDKEY